MADGDGYGLFGDRMRVDGREAVGQVSRAGMATSADNSLWPAHELVEILQRLLALDYAEVYRL